MLEPLVSSDRRPAQRRLRATAAGQRSVQLMIKFRWSNMQRLPQTRESAVDSIRSMISTATVTGGQRTAIRLTFNEAP